MSNESEQDGSEPGSVTVRMASNGVTDPDLLEQVYRLETEKETARVEAQRDRSFAQILVSKIVSSLEPQDLVPLIKLVAQAVAQRDREPGTQNPVRNEPVQNQNTGSEPNDTEQYRSPVRENVKDLGP